MDSFDQHLIRQIVCLALLASLLTGCIPYEVDHRVKRRELLYRSDYAVFVRGCYQGLMRAWYNTNPQWETFPAFSLWAMEECEDLAGDVLDKSQPAKNDET